MWAAHAACLTSWCCGCSKTANALKINLFTVYFYRLFLLSACCSLLYSQISLTMTITNPQNASIAPIAPISHVTIIGLGEVGGIFATALLKQGVAVRYFDRQDKSALAATLGLAAASSLPQALAGAQLIIAAVTASQTEAVAQAVAAHISQDAFYLDVNSASPSAKQGCAAHINAAGGRYLECAIMTTVPPYGIAVPMLLGGPHAADGVAALSPLGFSATDQHAPYGTVSAVKLCRSVMIKGLEAMVTESYTAARHYGVEDQVIASLLETFPTIDWEKQGDYLFSRVIMHGARRSEEMHESARTVRDAGLKGLMPYAAAEQQAYIAAQRKAGVFADPMNLKPWRERADALLATVKA
jgi:3-hydroxyisobutyrate dehydrogenase-like beta-hydroxyacid dehydrogenase